MKIYIMSKAHLWKCYDGKEQDYRRCRYCGRFIEDGEKYLMLVVGSSIGHNTLIHLEHLEEVLNNNNIKYKIEEDNLEIDYDYNDLMKIIFSKKFPKALNGNVENKDFTKKVKEVMSNLGFIAQTENSKTITFTNGSSRDKVRFKYKKVHKQFSCMNKLGLFDRLFVNKFFQKIDGELNKSYKNEKPIYVS